MATTGYFVQSFRSAYKSHGRILDTIRVTKKFTVRNLSSVKNEACYDIVVVGGGIVGMATARELKIRYPSFKMAVVEKEKELGVHQSGHNSGVIHAGIYYKPGSLKAKLCVEGLHLAYKFLDEKGIPYKKCGKLIVATNELEVSRLMDLYDRAQKNNCPDVKLIEGKDIKKHEPHCEGIKAIWSPHTGIVDWGLVTQEYGKDFQERGGAIHTSFPVDNFLEDSGASSDNEYPIRVIGNNNQSVRAKYVLTCGGLHADRLAEKCGCSKDPRIIPFRGEYLLLNPEKCNLINGNIYPVPDPRFPFLGVHFTPRMDGSVWLGPNAILAFKREGYRYRDIDFSDLFDALKYPGFQKLAVKYAVFGSGEIIRSAFISLQLKELRKYIPNISAKDIKRGPSGVRAQAVAADGTLVDDFVFDAGGKGLLSKRVLHCRNAPSPGATSSLSIAKMISDKMAKQMNL
ncbi:L-2-hydroxyglutarate dehydrogenase, mitochondrial [Ischnura elegans]|uniref:L-2-hydroxyglutarate dehydrogenase, mitochondrial n=1 Tax=Ischnura elegans TaxID=197161 RepID=UPI001ED87038|nr:L-2-hydroxyglutarate dehydrogenase, mitochondrial [Ischnura elegans]